MSYKYFTSLLFLVISLFFTSPSSASISDGTIPISTSGATSSLGFAWGANLGWVNFGSTFSNVHITDLGLTGYAWTANHGWINLNPSTIKVTNNGEGVLGGYAWGENLGWINFTGVTIDTNGEFRGYATVDQDGSKISFNCANTTFNADSCSLFNFKLITDWRPLSARSPAVAVISSGGSAFLPGGVIQPPHIEAYNAPLSILQQQSGTLTQDVSLGNLLINIPINSIPEPLSFVATEEPSTKANLAIIPADKYLLGSFYNIKAVNSREELVTQFINPIKIILPLPGGLTDVSKLKVYWIDEINNRPVEISNAIFSLKDKKVDFEVDHLTKFVVLGQKIKFSTTAAVLAVTDSDSFIDQVRDFFSFETEPEPKPKIKPKPIIKIKPSPELEIITPEPSVVPAIEPSITKEPSTSELPFNVSLVLTSNRLENSQDLKIQVKFEDFDKKPSPINLIFVIYDSKNKQVYSTQDNIIANNQDEYLKEFPDLELSSGKYTISVNTPDGLRLTGDLRKDFEILKKKQSFWQRECLGRFSIKCGLLPTGVLVAMIAVVFVLIKRNNKKTLGI